MCETAQVDLAMDERMIDESEIELVHHNTWLGSADDDDEGVAGDRDTGLATAEAKPELKRPPMYKAVSYTHLTLPTTPYV